MQLCNRINDNKRINSLYHSSSYTTAHVIAHNLTYLHEVWHAINRQQTTI